MNDGYKLNINRIFPFLLMIFLISCQNKNSSISEEVTTDNYEAEILDELFGVVDSSRIKESIGCVGGIYGLLDNEYVIRLPTNIFSPHNENITSFELGNNLEQVELIIFAKDSSHIINYCTDVQLMINIPKPKRTIKSIEGKIKSVTLYENHDNWYSNYCSYIKIDKIKFIDKFKGNQEIIIENVILWKVYDLGTPG